MRFYIKNVFRYFTIIYLSASIGAASLITLLYKGAVLNVDILWQLLGVSFISAMISSFLLESQKDISKKDIIIRMIIHCILIYILIMGSGILFNWINIDKINEFICFSIMILATYILVWIIYYGLDSKTANELNEKIKYYRDDN